ncbi:hypothetical protein SLEP1_g44653 [Rubroshorea leprosula]|uniref:Uncharacterized protein n=1 Tax=Rubroshorea leprosula TaxID=152421 RepID=A0AAV5LIH0_9ROSI|nr:hypothetical protein SLEP1_g44653 [Rubroshorea leprosula]
MVEKTLVQSEVLNIEEHVWCLEASLGKKIGYVALSNFAKSLP